MIIFWQFFIITGVGITTLLWLKSRIKNWSKGTDIAPSSTIMTTYLIVIKIAINIEHRGSAIIQPNWWMRMLEMITPTLPRVSARMCRNTPAGRGKHFFVVIE